MNRSMHVTLVLGALLCGFGVSQSFADLSYGTWYLSQSNTFPDDFDYGRVDVTANSTTGLVQFHLVSYLAPVYGGLGDNPGFQTFGFNFTGISDAPADWTWALPSNWDMKTGRNQDGFGKFQVVVEMAAHGSRHDPLDFEFTLPTADLAVASNFAVLSTGTAGQGNVRFAAHYAGFNNAPRSHYIGGGSVVPIPAPGAALLGTIGMSVVAALRRRLA